MAALPIPEKERNLYYGNRRKRRNDTCIWMPGRGDCIRGMVEKSAYCPDILVQVAAVNAALNAFNKELLANHIRTCVAEDIRAGKDEVIDELVATLQKLMK